MVWQLLLTAIAIGLIFWWYLQPHGFPVWHLRFWTNDIFPWCFVILALAAVAAARLGYCELLCLVIWLTPGVCIGLSLMARILFPISTAGGWLFVLGAGLFFAALAEALTKQRRSRWLAVASLSTGLLLGSVFAYSRRAPVPSTIPIANEMPSPRLTFANRLPIQDSWPGVKVEVTRNVRTTARRENV